MRQLNFSIQHTLFIAHMLYVTVPDVSRKDSRKAYRQIQLAPAFAYAMQKVDA